MKEIETLLQQQFKILGLQLEAHPFVLYLELLDKWNKVYNLTAIRDPSNMVTHHIMDSLAIQPWIKGSRLLDVGTGAGLPGIPLAIARPNLQVTLLDSNGKKIQFLREVKRQLKLENVEIVQTRANIYHPDLTFDTVTSRAVSDIASLLNWTHHLLSPSGIWLAMKGRVPADELKAIQYPYDIQQYAVLGLEGERCCIIIENLKHKE